MGKQKSVLNFRKGRGMGIGYLHCTDYFVISQGLSQDGGAFFCYIKKSLNAADN